MSNGCWEWNNWCNANGYGRTTQYVDGKHKHVMSHRLAYEIWYPISFDKELCVLHNCPTGDNPTCCNPEHLWQGTQQDNSNDCVRKRRHAHGTKVAKKLSESDVFEIRSRTESYQTIADDYGVSKTLVYRIKCQKAWKYLL